jgi:formamidopyrimidine-DNA glycosylase
VPELPEVQTIINDLKKVLPELKIRDVWSDHKKMVKIPSSFDKFKKEVVGEKFLGVERRGKNILIGLSHNKTLLVHQKMTGHLLFGKFEIQKTKHETKWVATEHGPLRDDPNNRFIHLLFSLSNGKALALCDMRKFAKVLIWPTDKLAELEDIKNIGPDPFDKALMDQKVIAGIGNIYADEILWVAGVHPLKKVEKLSEMELEKIFKAIKPVLIKAIKARGSSYIDYRDALGKMGNYQTMHYAYQMDGTKCKKKDGGIIKKIKIGQRSAHFCPVHQKL